MAYTEDAVPLRVLVERAGGGDAQAWNTLVERYAGLVWNIARGFRLSGADAADVSQTVWLRLVEHLGSLRDPDALVGWLATTTRHESLRVLRRHGREVLDLDEVTRRHDVPSQDPGPEAVTLREDRSSTVWRAVEGLSPRCQSLLRALASSQEHSYAEISAALGIPVGSIGPTRARCFDTLRSALAGLDLATAD